MSDTIPKVLTARIVQIMPTPAVLQDPEGNRIIGFALCEFTLQFSANLDQTTGRDIFPIGTDGEIMGVPGEDARYLLHAFGDIPDRRYNEAMTPDALAECWEEQR